MLTKTIQFQVFVLILTVLVQVSFVDAQIKYPETIDVLQIVYHNEIQANLTYLAYAQKAILDTYPNIAHLFVALAASESIHARNFKQLLSELGVEVKETSNPQIKVSTTKENLKKATQNELQDIDQSYPKFIERVTPEKYEAAIRNMTYSWEAEKQHRDLIKKIQSGTGILFGILSSTIERTPTRYYVCQACGSTMNELPNEACPICKSSVLQYKEIEKIK